MTMSENEIVRDYRTAKKKREQIGILADLNGCSREQIREILLRNGITEAELPAKPGRRPTAEENGIFRPAKTTKKKPGGGRASRGWWNTGIANQRAYSYCRA